MSFGKITLLCCMIITICHLKWLMCNARVCVGQVFSTGKLISFTKNNLEVCVKQVVDHHHVGLRDDVQGATLQNLACHFDKYAYSFSVHHN